MDKPSDRVDAASLARLQEALIDPTAEVACVGSRPFWARALVRMIGAATLVAAFASQPVSTMVEQSGLAQEWDASTDPMTPLPPVAQKVQWLQLPTSPFLEVAKRPDGSYSLDHLVGAYKAAGLSSQQGAQIMPLLLDLSPVLMGAADPILAKKFQRDAQQAAEELATRYPQALAKLKALQESDNVPSSPYYGPKGDTSFSWIPLRAAWLKTASAATRLPASDAVSDMQMPEARQALENAMRTTGVRALRVPASSWPDARAVFDLAIGLEQANAELATATGWDGQVLGLGGRVVLSISSPPDILKADGITAASRDGQIRVVAQWDSLAHEWMHAVDYASATKTMDNSAFAALSEQLKPLRFVRDGSSFAAWKQASDQLQDQAPDWIRSRQEQARQSEHTSASKASSDRDALGLQSDAAYWSSNVERFGYAFSAFMSSQPSELLKSSNNNNPSHVLPSSEESARQAPAFRKLFASIEHLHLSQPMANAPLARPVLASQISKRRQAGTLPTTYAIAPPKAPR